MRTDESKEKILQQVQEIQGTEEDMKSLLESYFFTYYVLDQNGQKVAYKSESSGDELNHIYDAMETDPVQLGKKIFRTSFGPIAQSQKNTLVIDQLFIAEPANLSIPLDIMGQEKTVTKEYLGNTFTVKQASMTEDTTLSVELEGKVVGEWDNFQWVLTDESGNRYHDEPMNRENYELSVENQNEFWNLKQKLTFKGLQKSSGKFTLSLKIIHHKYDVQWKIPLPTE